MSGRHEIGFMKKFTEDFLGWVLAGVAGLTAFVICGTLGDNGTKSGILVSAVVTGGAGSLYKALALQLHSRARNALGRNVSWRSDKTYGQYLKSPAVLVPASVSAVVVVALAFVSAVSVEATTGKTFHGALTSSHDYGSTFTGSSTVSPTPAPSTAVPTMSSSGSEFPSPTPTVSGASFGVESPTAAGSPSASRRFSGTPSSATSTVPSSVQSLLAPTG